MKEKYLFITWNTFDSVEDAVNDFYSVGDYGGFNTVEEAVLREGETIVLVVE